MQVRFFFHRGALTALLILIHADAALPAAVLRGIGGDGGEQGVPAPHRWQGVLHEDVAGFALRAVVTLGEVRVALVQLQRAGRLGGAGGVVLVVVGERVQLSVAVLQSGLLFDGPWPEFSWAERWGWDGQTVSSGLHL